MRPLLPGLVALVLAACTSSRPAYDAALDRPVPPPDFWLAVSVLGPLRSTGYSHLARAERPARYVAESDRVLRAALGPGASEDAFPPQLRNLSDEQWQGLWEVVRSTNLARADTASDFSLPPTLEDAPDKTVVVISFLARGVRRHIAVDLAAGDSGASADALKIADAMADLAWIPERAAQAP